MKVLSHFAALLLVAALLMLPLGLFSCIEIGPDYFDEEANYIRFTVKVEQGDIYKEVRIFSKEKRNGIFVNADSTIHNSINKNGKDKTFPNNEGFSISIFADSVALIQEGVFEAIAVKSDNSLIRKEFGKISDGSTQKSFNIKLKPEGILIE